MRKRMYLIKIGNKWCFRRRMPKHLVEVIGKREFKESLNSSDEETANKRYAEVLLRCENCLEEAAQLFKGTPPASLRDLDVEWAVKSWFTAKYYEMVENDVNPFSNPEQRANYIKECFIERDFWSKGHPTRIAAGLQRATYQVLIAQGFPKGAPLSPDSKSKTRGQANIDRTETKYLRLEELMGEKKSVRDITRQDFRGLPDILIQMPANARELTRTKDRHLLALIEDEKNISVKSCRLRM